MATPSSKHNPAMTPTQNPTSSPHPSAVHTTKPFSHKSPSIRTPSATGGITHGHQLSVSSHQYATPLAASVGIDDPVSLSSPSALLALGNYTGVTPSPGVQDGLVGGAISHGDIMRVALALSNGPRDHEQERRNHIREVVRLLRNRVAGRGVSKDAIVRLSQLEGFELIWQDNNLSIAGNWVDLEIEFYSGEDVVKDVSLKYSTLEALESVRRDAATTVLKRNLTLSPEEREWKAWKPLTDFHENLERLAKLDKLSQEVNCFEAVEGLFESLYRVWDEEERRGKYRGVYDHLCHGWVGRPTLHEGNQLGMVLEYWIAGHRVMDASTQRSDCLDAMEIEQSASNRGSGSPQNKRSVIIECEVGFPSLRVSKDWVGNEVLIAVDSNSTSTPSESTASNMTQVNWIEPSPTLISSVNGNQTDPMTLNSGMVGSVTPNRRFVAKLEPPLDLPLLVASDVYRHLGFPVPPEFKIVTYDGLLVPSWNEGSTSTLDETQQTNNKKRAKPVLIFDDSGKAMEKQHVYTFQTFEAVQGGEIRELPFSHPRQLADVFPILRQYGLLTTLIQRIFPASTTDANIQSKSAFRNAGSKMDTHSPRSPDGKGHDVVTILTNVNPNQEILDSFLNDTRTHWTSASHHKQIEVEELLPPGDMNGSSVFEDNNSIQVDITLRTQTGQAPLIMLLVTFVDPTKESSSENNQSASFAVRRVSVNFEVGLNGRITVTHATGLANEEAMETDEDRDAESPDAGNALRKKMGRVLEISEDLGVLVEWMLQRVINPSLLA